jgi:ubiquinone/menaquinone biosynthesis C-methylase UbiE
MDLNDLKTNWTKFGEQDPYWAIATEKDKKNGGWSDEEFFLTGTKFAKQTLQQIKEVNTNFCLDKALDFGCGAGRITQGLSNHFKEVIGVDIASSMVALAKKKNSRPNCSFYLNEKNDLSFLQDSSIDLVFSYITLQHMNPEYSKKYIQEFFRILKPNGLLYFQIPAKPDFLSKIYQLIPFKFKEKLLGIYQSKKINFKSPAMEMYWIPKNEIIYLINNLGGKVEKIIPDNAVGGSWESYTYIVSKNI